MAAHRTQSTGPRAVAQASLLRSTCFSRSSLAKSSSTSSSRSSSRPSSARHRADLSSTSCKIGRSRGTNDAGPPMTRQRLASLQLRSLKASSRTWPVASTISLVSSFQSTSGLQMITCTARSSSCSCRCPPTRTCARLCSTMSS